MIKYFIFWTLLSVAHPNVALSKTASEGNLYPAMTNKMRLKLIEMHQQITSCLMAGKTFEDCRESMETICRDFAQLMPMKGSGMMQEQGLMLKGGHKAMGGYPGMMTVYCENKCPPSDPKESKAQ